MKTAKTNNSVNKLDTLNSCIIEKKIKLMFDCLFPKQ